VGKGYLGGKCGLFFRKRGGGPQVRVFLLLLGCGSDCLFLFSATDHPFAKAVQKILRSRTG